MSRLTLVIVAALLWSVPDRADAQTEAPSADRALARDILRELVEINTTDSLGNTPRAARAMARRLVAAGFPAADVRVLIGPDARHGNLDVVVHGFHGRIGHLEKRELHLAFLVDVRRSSAAHHLYVDSRPVRLPLHQSQNLVLHALRTTFREQRLEVFPVAPRFQFAYRQRAAGTKLVRPVKTKIVEQNAVESYYHWHIAKRLQGA